MHENGSQDLNIMANDGEGGTADFPFTIIVEAVNDSVIFTKW